ALNLEDEGVPDTGLDRCLIRVEVDALVVLVLGVGGPDDGDTLRRERGKAAMSLGVIAVQADPCGPVELEGELVDEIVSRQPSAEDRGVLVLFPLGAPQGAVRDGPGAPVRLPVLVERLVQVVGQQYFAALGEQRFRSRGLTGRGGESEQRHCGRGYGTE